MKKYNFFIEVWKGELGNMGEYTIKPIGELEAELKRSINWSCKNIAIFKIKLK